MQALERKLRAVALAQSCEIEPAAVTAGIAVRVQLVALAEVADRANGDRTLARSLSPHRLCSLFVLAMLAAMLAPVNVAAQCPRGTETGNVTYVRDGDTSS